MRVCRGTINIGIISSPLYTLSRDWRLTPSECDDEMREGVKERGTLRRREKEAETEELADGRRDEFGVEAGVGFCIRTARRRLSTSSSASSIHIRASPCCSDVQENDRVRGEGGIGKIEGREHGMIYRNKILVRRRMSIVHIHIY